MNESLFRFLNGHAGRLIAFDAIIVFCTDSMGIVLVFVLLLFAVHAFYHGRRKDSVSILSAFAYAGAAWLVGFVMKQLIAAPRPAVLLPDVRELIAYGGRDAFPSGHTTFYFALGVALFFYNKKLGVATMALALMIGLARVAAGIHWPVDIVGGAAVGGVVVMIANRLITYYTARRW